MALKPYKTLLRDGQEMTVPVEQVRAGDLFAVRPGANIPTDGTVVSGSGSVDESALTGDGKAHTVTGNPVTIMAGLNCGTPCSTIWPILRDCSAYFCACDDAVTD